MSTQLIARSADLRHLRDAGYDITVVAGHLIIRQVPYVTPSRQVALGTLVSTLMMAGDVTIKPDTHVVTFAGETPCDPDGRPLEKLIIGRDTQLLGGVTVNFTFSSKPPDGYPDYFEKMTAYIRMLTSQAAAIDPTATANVFPVIEADEADESPLRYVDTASSRAGIDRIAAKLAGHRVAIIGLGGTGSYVLDLLAKTPVKEIHLYDGDLLLQHNAFRAPGAPSVVELRSQPRKVDYWADRYGQMHSGIVTHPYKVTPANAVELDGFDYVFLTADTTDETCDLVIELERLGLTFIDAGLGVRAAQHDTLAGLVRVTTSTPNQRSHVWDNHRIPFELAEGNDYEVNVQVADLNALNACFAVIKWKKLCGFYDDTEREHFMTYAISGNYLVNDDRS